MSQQQRKKRALSPIASEPHVPIFASTEVKRARILRLDPSCREKLASLQQELACSEDEAWTLFENGAADQQKADIKKTDPRKPSSSSSSSSSSTLRAPVMAPTQQRLPSEEEQLRWAMEASLTETEPVHSPDIVSTYSHDDCPYSDTSGTISRALQTSHQAYSMDGYLSSDLSEDGNESVASEKYLPRRTGDRLAAKLSAIHEDKEVVVFTPLKSIPLTAKAKGRRKEKVPLSAASSVRSNQSETLEVDLTIDEDDLPSRKCYSQASKSSIIESDIQHVINLCDSQPEEKFDFDINVMENASNMDKETEDVRMSRDLPLTEFSRKKMIEEKFIDSAEEMYKFDSVSPLASLTLLVDNRERNRNSTYRDFFKMIQSDFHQFSSLTACPCEAALTLGDFFFALEEAVEGQDEARYFAAGAAIERKAISDIVTRSAGAGEGPHFKQERHLRFSGLRHAAVLLEGELRVNPDRMFPRVSSRPEGHTDLDRLDVISSSEELLGYVCGIICRNFAPRNICSQLMVLQTLTPKDTAIMLAALATVLDDHHKQQQQQIRNMDRGTAIRRPLLQSVSKYWDWRQCHRRSELLEQELLAAAGLSDDMLTRIGRRFGGLKELAAAYSLCDSAVHRRDLLRELSSAGSNLTEAVLAREEQPVGQEEMTAESRAVMEAVCPAESPRDLSLLNSPFSVVPNGNHRVVRARISPELSALLGSLDGFPDFVRFEQLNLNGSNVCSSSSGKNELPFCEVHVEDASLARASVCPVRKCSSPLFVVVVSGGEVLSLLGAAHDRVARDRFGEGFRQVVQGKDSSFDLAVVREALCRLTDSLPVALTERLTDFSQSKKPILAQVVLLVENLGHGMGRTGACGRLQNALNDVCNRIRQNEIAGEDEDCKNVYFGGKDRGTAMSYGAAQYLSAKLRWFVNLFTAMVVTEKEWQLVHVSEQKGALPAGNVIAVLLQEMHRLALLPFDNIP